MYFANKDQHRYVKRLFPDYFGMLGNSLIQHVVTNSIVLLSIEIL